jgi:hypothetical protein
LESTKKLSHARSPKLARGTEITEKNDNMKGFDFTYQKTSLSAPSASQREISFDFAIIPFFHNSIIPESNALGTSGSLVSSHQ